MAEHRPANSGGTPETAHDPSEELAKQQATWADLELYYRKFAPRMYSYLRSRGADRSSAEDTVDEAFIKLYKRKTGAPGDRTTVDKRRLAVAADAELRRRHPGQHFVPLRSAEPGGISDAQRDGLVFKVEESIPAVGPWIQNLAADRTLLAAKLASGRTRPEPTWISVAGQG